MVTRNTAFAMAAILMALAAAGTLAAEPWSVRSSSQWKQETASADKVVIEDGLLVLDGARRGQWTSRWHDWQRPIESAKTVVEAEIDLFDNKTIEVVVDCYAHFRTIGFRVPFSHGVWSTCFCPFLNGKW